MTKENNAVRLSEMLQAYDRRPFLDVVEMLLRNGPTEEVVAELAKTAPDKWGQLVKVMSQLGGFADAKVVTHRLDLEQMSDYELTQWLKNREAPEVPDTYEALKLHKAKRLQAIEVEVVEVGPPKDAPQE